MAANLQRFPSQVETQDQLEASEYISQRSISGSASESNLLLLNERIPIQDQMGTSSRQRQSHSKSVPPAPHSRFHLCSGGLPITDFAKLVKPKFHPFRRLSSHPLDDNTLSNKQYHQLQQQPQQEPPAVPLTKAKLFERKLAQNAERKLASNRRKETLHKLVQGQQDTGSFFRKFYFVANQCFIEGEVLIQCALCTLNKCVIAGHHYKLHGPTCSDQKQRFCTPRMCNRSNGVRHPDSHIFPRALLKSYGKIHCREQVNFIYDPSYDPSKVDASTVNPSSTKKMKGIGQLAFPLFLQ